MIRKSLINNDKLGIMALTFQEQKRGICVFEFQISALCFARCTKKNTIRRNDPRSVRAAKKVLGQPVAHQPFCLLRELVWQAGSPERRKPQAGRLGAFRGGCFRVLGRTLNFYRV